jgi:phosphate transport system permease protein
MMDETAPPDLRARRTWRSTQSTLMTLLMVLAVVVIAIPLVAVVYSVITRGAGAAFASFPDFFTKDIPAVTRRAGPGMGPAILGTLLVTAAATAIAVPIGVLGAVYLHEYGGQGRFARAVRFMAMVMTGVPSIVMGLFVYIMWTMRFGYSAFGGALALACLMLPVVIGSTEQMLRLVPSAQREAAYALGATKSRTILTVVLPAALPGIVSGSLLAVARAAGETAPLLFAVGAAKTFNPQLFSEANTALSIQIFSSDLAFPATENRAWGAALTLVLLTFLLTFVARVFTSRFALKR